MQKKIESNKFTKINIGLIGFGYWGPNYARILSSLEKVNLKWVIDLDQKLLKKAKKDLPNVQISQKYKDLLNDNNLQAVIVATPTTTHAEIVSNILRAKKHVLVEKPLATSTAAAQKLNDLAKSRKITLMVGQTYLFNPAIIYLKNEIKKGILGNILYFTAQRTNLGPIRNDVNAMWDLATHDISTILYLAEAKPIAVTASGFGFLNKKLEDVVNLTIKFENNIFASILVSWLAPIKIRQLTIVCDKKMAIFDDVNVENKIKIMDKTIIQLEKGQTIPFEEFKQLSLSQGRTIIPALPSNEPLKEEVLNFISAISKKETPKVTPGHAYDVVKILEAAEKSLKLKKAINL